MVNANAPWSSERPAPDKQWAAINKLQQFRMDQALKVSTAFQKADGFIVDGVQRHGTNQVIVSVMIAPPVQQSADQPCPYPYPQAPAPARTAPAPMRMFELRYADENQEPFITGKGLRFSEMCRIVEVMTEAQPSG